MSKATPTRPSPSAIPILMRLPDLRVAADSRRARPPRQERLSERPPLADVADSAQEPAEVEAAVEAELQDKPAVIQPPLAAAPDQTERIAASSDTTASEISDGSEEKPTSSVEESAKEASSAVPETVALVPTVSQQEKSPEPDVVSSKPDVTNASPADCNDPVSPAAARRQRALERQRRQVVEPPRQRSWWTTHLPIIGVGFLVALVLTIYVGRRNRVQRADGPQAAADLPEIEIDTGDGRDSLSPTSSEPAVLAIDRMDDPVPAESEILPKSKSPPLLSAKPKLQEAEPVREEAPENEPIRTAAGIGNSGAEITNQYVTSPGADSAPTGAELTTDAAANYPSTEPAVYRPGGRVPREARVPNYPETSTPHLR